MKFRRNQGGRRRLVTLTVKSFFLCFMSLVVIVYLVSFAAVIGTENQKKIEEEFQSVLQSAHNSFRGTRPLEIPADHGAHDRLAVERLGSNEQEHEIAPMVMENAEGQQEEQQQQNGDAVSIGYAVTITGCGSDPITEGAAVLKHSIHLTSIHGNMNGRYDYQMYALYHPSAIKCAKTLESLGYKLVERETPVAVEDIKGDFLRSRIEKNGCCGEKELIKLEAYTLTQHQVVVHLDLDTLILQPLDGLFDWMLLGNQARTFDASSIELQWPEDEIPEKINAFFTRDCKFARRRNIQTKTRPKQTDRCDIDANSTQSKPFVLWSLAFHHLV